MVVPVHTLLIRRRMFFLAELFHKNAALADSSPQKVAAMLVSDFVNGTNNRNPASIEIASLPEGYTPVVNDLDSELQQLSEISIVARQAKAVDNMTSISGGGIYGQYFKELQSVQRRIFVEEIKKLIARARAFNFVNYKERLIRDGRLSDAETSHLDIVAKISKQRIDTLERQQDVMFAILGGKK